MKKIIIILLAALLCSNLFAQQVPAFTQFYLNPYVYNPAYAGKSDKINVWAMYNIQMAGMPGAPRTQAITVDFPIASENMGLGFYAYNDKINIIGFNGGYGSYRYRVKLPHKQYIYFGVSMGVVQNKLLYDEIVAQTPDELLYIYDIKSTTSFQNDAGIIYQLKNLEVGFSAKNILNVWEKDDPYKMNFEPIPHFLTTIKYDFSVSDDFQAFPSLAIRTAKGLGIQVDVNGIMEWKKKLWAGLNYKSNASFGATLGFRHDNLTIGYAYAYPMNDVAKASIGSHEIFVGYAFNKKKKKRVDLLDENDDLFNQITGGNDGEETNRTKTGGRSRSDTLYHVIIFDGKDDIKKLLNIHERDKKETDNTIKNYGVPVEGFTDDEFAYVKDTGQIVETVKDDQYYIVIGAYLRFDDAKYLQKIVMREFTLETTIVRSHDQKYYFVVSKEVQNNEEAITEINRLRKIDRLSDYVYGRIWMYGKK